jgi:hypothetical protein
MEDTGQADNGPESAPDLAQFLIDNPTADREEPEQPSDEPADADTSDEQEDQSAEDDADAEADEADADAESEKKPEEQAPGQKFKVTVKGEDGADQTLEVDQKELVAGYTRHADYTRKTQELAHKEREAAQIFTSKLEEGRTHYMQQAQVARAAVLELAGLRSAEEMAALAQVDPALWVQESQRATAIRGKLEQIEQHMRTEQAQQMQQVERQRQERHSAAWQELQKDGIDRPALQKVYETVTTRYGLSAEQMAGIDDPKVVRILRDAAAFHELKAKSVEVVKKAKAAPPLPPARQAPTRTEQAGRRLNERFRSGKANTRDLASFIQANKL